MKNENLYLYILLLFGHLLINWLSKNLLNIDDLVIASLSEQLTYEQIVGFIDLQNRLSWVYYAIFPLLLFLKIILITTVIKLGLFFFEKSIAYKVVFNSVVKAEFIFLLPIVLKTAWFYFFQTNYSLEDLQYFYPLSAINIVGYEGLDPWWVYPFQVLNLFELAYWFILAYLIGKQINSTTDKGLTIVASSYGVALLIWVVGVMFFTLNVS